MTVKDKSVSAWQIGILLFILLFANKILVLPSLLYEGAKVEAFFIPIILFAFDLGLLILFYKVKTKFPTQSFAEIIKEHFGKVVTYIVFILIMIFFICKAVLLYNITYIFFRNLIYKETDNILFLFCFLPVINHLAISGLRVMGRTAQLFFPVIVVITLFCIVVGFFGIGSTPLFFDSSFSDVMLTAFKHISSFGDVLFLFVFMDKIQIKKGQWKILFSLAGSAMIVVTIITVVFIFSYTYTSFMHPYALFEIMSYVKEYGGLGRIDIISIVLIIIYTYFHLAIYLKTFMASFNVVFRKIDEIYSVLTFNFLFLIFINFLVLNLEKAVFYGEDILPYFSVISFIVVPLICLVHLCFKHRKKRGD